jgi:cytochrome c-type biogenesis protein CcmH
MIIFWGLCGLLTLVGLGSILPPLWRPSRMAPRRTLSEANAAIYREGIGELESDLAAGLITPAQFDRDRRELERRATVDLSAEPRRASHQRSGGSSALVVCLAIGIPVAAIAAYLALGTPEAIWR